MPKAYCGSLPGADAGFQERGVKYYVCTKFGATPPNCCDHMAICWFLTVKCSILTNFNCFGEFTMFQGRIQDFYEEGSNACENFKATPTFR